MLLTDAFFRTLLEAAFEATMDTGLSVRVLWESSPTFSLCPYPLLGNSIPPTDRFTGAQTWGSRPVASTPEKLGVVNYVINGPRLQLQGIFLLCPSSTQKHIQLPKNVPGTLSVLILHPTTLITAYHHVSWLPGIFTSPFSGISERQSIFITQN